MQEFGEYLIRLDNLDDTFIFDMKYAAKENFLGEKLYSLPLAILRKNTAIKLQKAQKYFLTKGYCLKIWDAYRPHSVQKLFWEALPDERFVADPNKNGSKHSYGCAVDVTLVDATTAKEIEMPSAFDDMSVRATRGNLKMAEEARKNMNILTVGMEMHGFLPLEEEWWHYTDNDYEKYTIMDVLLEDFT